MKFEKKTQHIPNEKREHIEKARMFGTGSGLKKKLQELLNSCESGPCGLLRASSSHARRCCIFSHRLNS
ncbi:hypothetical protein GWI33_020751 [Rhynchophorus ferrugineus]|uniref:Uncharacterized protein n=1 Tax=Rhynchophorus ferrugineus TaxID=354439 RepID=A0A834HNM7_RHYFE|nr:hypothetical protein GWI33_020751 [Rhynchophorus ferrugineus]